MKKNDYLITHTDYEIIDKNNKVIGYRSARNFLTLSSLLKSCDIGLSTVMIKKTFFQKKYYLQTLEQRRILFYG